MTRDILLAGLIAAGSCVTQPAIAQTPLSNCNTYTIAQQMLSIEYGEHVAWEGVVSDNMVIIQLWINPETGTWTYLVVSPDGNACVVADGMAYTFVAPPIPGDDM